MLLALGSHEYPTDFINYEPTCKVREWPASTSGARIQFPVQTQVDSVPNATTALARRNNVVYTYTNCTAADVYSRLCHHSQIACITALRSHQCMRHSVSSAVGTS